jgi:hypothetical protein
MAYKTFYCSFVLIKRSIVQHPNFSWRSVCGNFADNCDVGTIDPLTHALPHHEQGIGLGHEIDAERIVKDPNE